MTLVSAAVVEVDLVAAEVVFVFGRHGRLRDPDHHLQRLLGHRRNHLPLPRPKESKQRVSYYELHKLTYGKFLKNSTVKLLKYHLALLLINRNYDLGLQHASVGFLLVHTLHVHNIDAASSVTRLTIACCTVDGD